MLKAHSNLYLKNKIILGMLLACLKKKNVLDASLILVSAMILRTTARRFSGHEMQELSRNCRHHVSQYELL